MCRTLFIDCCYCSLPVIPFSVDSCESRIYILPLLPIGLRTIPLMGSSWWSWSTRLRVILSCCLCLYDTYGVPVPTSHICFLWFNYRWSQPIVSTTYSTCFTRGSFTFILSHPDLAYICVFWAEKDDSCRSFSYILPLCRCSYLG